MLTNISKVLKFLRLVDDVDGNLSLSSIAVIIVLGKLVVAPSGNISDALPVFIALLNYSAKKIINNQTQS
jgi:hypothetical protein